MAESPSPSGPSASDGKENQMSRSSSSGLFSKYKGKYKTYLAERRANSKSKASQDLDSVAEAAIASDSRQPDSRKQSPKEAAAAAQAADNAALDKDMDAFFEEVSQIKVTMALLICFEPQMSWSTAPDSSACMYAFTCMRVVSAVPISVQLLCRPESTSDAFCNPLARLS